VRFASLGSGSRGNALVVESGATRLLIDCGFSLRETEYRLGRLGLDGSAISAVVVTHEHGDHVGGLGPFARRHGVPVWMTSGSRQGLESGGTGHLPDVRVFSPHERFAIGDVELNPYPVPHDAREPCQFVFGDGAVRLGLLTDAGSITPHIVSCLGDCDALLVECNHDRGMLERGPYSRPLKDRVGGPYGHLDNDTAAALLGAVASGRLRHVVAMHLSETNNAPALATTALQRVLGGDTGALRVASQDDGFDWCDLYD